MTNRTRLVRRNHRWHPQNTELKHELRTKQTAVKTNRTRLVRRNHRWHPQNTELKHESIGKMSNKKPTKNRYYCSLKLVLFVCLCYGV